MHNAAFARTRPEPSLSSLFHAAPVRFLDVGHSRVACRSIGSGPDLLFIHGWPLNGATFRGIVPALAPHFRCHVFDLPGAGATEITAHTPLSLGEHVDTTRRVIEALGLERFGIVAHDSGGYIARAVAANDPRVLALVMGNTEVPGHMPRVVRDLRALLRLPFGSLALRNLLRLRAVRRYAFATCFAQLDHVDGEFHELFMRPALREPRRAAPLFELVRALDARIFAELPALHRRIAADVLLVWGDRDPIFPVRLAREMVGQFPRARLELIEGGRCFVHDERPEAFTALALPFLQHAFARSAASTAA